MVDMLAMGSFVIGLLLLIIGLARVMGRAGVGHGSAGEVARLNSAQRREKRSQVWVALLDPAQPLERRMIALGISLSALGIVSASFLVK